MTQQEYREDLITRIGRLNDIISSLDGCYGFQELVKDVKNQDQKIDEAWFLVPEDDKWYGSMKELRMSKLANKYIINSVGIYQEDLRACQEELQKLDNQDSVVLRDYDAN